MFRAAYSDFLLSATSGETNSEVFLTDTTIFSAGCINNPNTTVISLTAGSPSGYLITNKGSFSSVLSFQAGQTNKNIGPLGLTTDPLPQAPSYINYGWLIQDDGTAVIQESGSNVVGTLASYTTDTIFKIIYSNNSIKYYRNDILIRTVNGVFLYLYAGFSADYTDSGASLTNFVYTRSVGVNSQPAPYTVTFQPSSINFEDQFVSKITYVMPDRVVTRNFTFSTLQDALTGTTKDIDSRSNYSYTFYNAASGELTHVVTISAILFPSLSALEYKISIPVTKPRFTRNPSLSSGDTFLFDSAFLLKSRAWGPNNTVVLVGEGINYDNTNQLFLLSATQ